jgi:acyl-CoA synthetase (AMP-forming)/AMP-acid ligase II
MDRTKNYAFADHSMIFLQGSPVLDKKGVIPAGRLSGIAAHHVPAYLQKNRMPSWNTNCIDDWETKVDAIVEETLKKRMSLISGIPSWLRMYFEKLVDKAGKPVGEIFPDFSLLVYGGLNYEPYRQAFDRLIGRHVDTIELYPASEGFIAYQDDEPGKGLLLNVNSGIFFEFIPVDKVHDEIPERIPLEGVEAGVDYAIVLSSNAGLWGYQLGDTVRFVSLDPYRLVVSGRISQFISAFGEHVIASEVESALAEVCASTGARVAEFTVAPVVNPLAGLPYHQWLIEFDGLPGDSNNIETQNIASLKDPASLQRFATRLDQAMRRRNPYYDDLVEGHVLEPLHIITLPKGAFKKYLESKGKLGGQNKVAHLSDSREMADELISSLQISR